MATAKEEGFMVYERSRVGIQRDIKYYRTGPCLRMGTDRVKRTFYGGMATGKKVSITREMRNGREGATGKEGVWVGFSL